MREEIKQPELTTYSGVSLNRKLMDVRMGRYGLTYGTVEKVCKQYGIKYKKVENTKLTAFTAPKLRLQMFIEKLHFSKISYTPPQ